MKPKIKNDPTKIERELEDVMTMVIHTGEVGTALKELESDMKKVLNPYSFMKLRVHRKNKLRDFTEVATPLGAKMMMLFRCQLDKTSLSLCRFPRGPTVYFDVLRYATIHDVHSAFPETTANYNKQARHVPFLVLSGFSSSDSDQVIVSMFQGLFPAVRPGQENVSLMKRVVLVSKNEDNSISLRHYKVSSKNLNDGITGLLRGKIPDLSEYNEIDDYIMENVKASKKGKQKCAIRLVEIGPRIDMTFNHLETAVFGGMKLSTDEEKPKEPKPYKYRPPKREKPKFNHSHAKP